MSQRHIIQYDGNETRLDRVIVAELSVTVSLSRSQVERWIEGSLVQVNGKVVTKPAYKVVAGDTIEVEVAPEKPTDVPPLNCPWIFSSRINTSW